MRRGEDPSLESPPATQELTLSKAGRTARRVGVSVGSLLDTYFYTGPGTALRFLCLV